MINLQQNSAKFVEIFQRIWFFLTKCVFDVQKHSRKFETANNLMLKISAKPN